MVILLASSLLAITVQVHSQCAVAGLFSLPGLYNSLQCLFFPAHSPWDGILSYGSEGTPHVKILVLSLSLQVP